MEIAGDGGLRWTSGRTCGGGDGDPTAEAHDTYKVSFVLKCSSQQGRSRPGPKFPRRKAHQRIQQPR